MSDTNSTNATPTVKRERPEGETTLHWHSSGRWAKKILGRRVYFGSGTYEEALVLYNQQREDLHAGRKPRDAMDQDPEHLTVFKLCAEFLATKDVKLVTGEITQRTFDDYAAACKLVLKAFGKGRLVSDLKPNDFRALKKRMARTWGLVRIGNEINRVRIIFRYGIENDLIRKRVVFGEGFARPGKKTLRKHRAKQGPKDFTAYDLRCILGLPPWAPLGATLPLRAMILLGINGGIGNSDVASIPIRAFDLAGGWLDFAREKTGIDRRIPLWPETVAAVREWLAVRPEPADEKHAGLLFITKYGQPWGIENRSLSNEMRKLLDSLDINGHRNFYSLRHTFQTIGDEGRDFIAVRRIMGHATDDIADDYREFISDQRLRETADYVRKWLFG